MPPSEQSESNTPAHEGSPIHISLRAEEIFSLGSFHISNSLLLAVIVMVILGTTGALLRKKFSLIPSKIQNALELLLEGFLSVMDSVLGERSKSEKYLPLVVTIFLFVLFSNWFGLLPGVGSLIIGPEHTPLFRAPSADLNFTLGLAIVAVLGANVFGVIALGFFKHMSKFISFKNPISFFIGLIELVSEIAKMISFSFRLFGNIFAGEVLLAIIGFLVPYVLPLPFLALETFVGLIQAVIFSMLTIVFIAIAVAGHDEEHVHA